jgi:hypothetical protein
VPIHHKHWFDEDITIVYFEFVMELYPSKRVGLIWDAATQHSTEKVLNFIAQHVDLLVVVGFSGGRTSLIQVSDLVANKLLKQLIHGGSYQWCTAFIQDKKAKIAASG